MALTQDHERKFIAQLEQRGVTQVRSELEHGKNSRAVHRILANRRYLFNTRFGR